MDKLMIGYGVNLGSNHNNNMESNKLELSPQKVDNAAANKKPMTLQEKKEMASKIDETQNRNTNQPFKLGNSKDLASNLIDMNLNSLSITNNSQQQPSNTALLSQISSDFNPVQPALTYYNTNITATNSQFINNFNNSTMNTNNFPSPSAPHIRPSYTNTQNNIQMPQQQWSGMRPLGNTGMGAVNNAYKPMVSLQQTQPQTQQANSQIGFFGNLALPPPPQAGQTLMPTQIKSAQNNTGKKSAFDDLADLLG